MVERVVGIGVGVGLRRYGVGRSLGVPGDTAGPVERSELPESNVYVIGKVDEGVNLCPLGQRHHDACGRFGVGPRVVMGIECNA